jgi:hypothetical protein
MRDFRRNENEFIEDASLVAMCHEARKYTKADEIKIEDFKDLYGEKNIENDRLYVEGMEKKFKEDLTPEKKKLNQLAAVFEAIIYEHGELSDWFGPSAFMIKPSRYDDIKNGVDEVVEFQIDEYSASHLALAIDVTFSHEMQNKFERIKKENDTGKLTKVKYFNSDHLNIRGELSRVPRVVVGAEARTVKELGELWMEEKNKELGKHSIQFQILKEILMQAKVFSRYANQKGKSEIAGIYDKMAIIVEQIYKDKLKEQNNTTVDFDDVFYSMERELDNFLNLNNNKQI